MGQRTSVVVANDYDNTVYVLIGHEKKYVTSSSFHAAGGVGAAGVKVKGEVGRAEHFDWIKIESKFTRITKGGYQKFELDLPLRTRQVFVTILSAKGKVLSEALPRFGYNNLIVAETGQVCDAKPGTIREYEDPTQAGQRGNEGDDPKPESGMPDLRRF